MHIGILSRNPTLYSTRRLVQAARAQGHKVSVVDTMTVAVEIGTSTNRGIKTVEPQLPSSPSQSPLAPSLWSYQAGVVKSLPSFDGIIPRIGASITAYGVAVVEQFETLAIPTTATASAIAHSRDKLQSLQLMSQAGLPVPQTAVIAQPESLFYAINAVGQLPVVLKRLQSTQGQGVFLARDIHTAVTALYQLGQLRQQTLVQEFIAEAEGKDTRIIVVGGRCVAAMERQATSGEFRSNLHLGGTAVAIQPTDKMQRLAIAAARAHGLSVAGVDLIRAKRGLLVLEVNSSPGLEGIEQATEVDIANEIVSFLVRQREHPNRRTQNLSKRKNRQRKRF